MKITYEDFASESSFFEFQEEEFGEIMFPKDKYLKELSLVNKIKNINDLAKNLETYPKLFDLYEGYFQLTTFSVAQYTNFLFDVNKLNYNDEKTLEIYCENSCLKYENSEPNNKFSYYYNGINSDTFSKYKFKRAIAGYTNYLQKSKMDKPKRIFLLNHISKNITSRTRIAEYLVNRYNLAQHSAGKLIEDTLLLKRQPVDAKTFSGRYGSYRIEKALNESGFAPLSTKYGKVLTLENRVKAEGFYYVREAKINSSEEELEFKNKVFDFILLKNGKPFFLIETNFYSTSGSKIGINEDEYIKISKQINSVADKNNWGLYFSWITDGNYWLSTTGMNKWEKIRLQLTKDYEILNFSLFSKYLKEIKKIT
jgi:hypothetical protein